MRLLFRIGKPNDAASDNFAWVFLLQFWMNSSCWEFYKEGSVLTFVEGDSSADNAVRSAEHNNWVSAHEVGSVVVHNAALHVLKITDTSLVDIIVGLTTFGSKGVVDVADGTTLNAAAGQVSELMDFHCLFTWNSAFEMTTNESEIVGILD